MKYSNYFGMVFRSQGIPQISVHQMQRLMNIVATENELKGMLVMKPKINKNQHHDMNIWKKERQLVELTGNQKPKDLMQEMFSLSTNY